MKNRLTKVCDGMKKMIPWIIASAVIMLVFPWLAVTFVKGDGGMAVCFILFFALNPIYAIFAGAHQTLLGLADDHRALVFSRYMAAFRYGRTGVSSLCVDLLAFRDRSHADFRVYKENT